MSIVFSDYVKARWAYSELLSPAFGHLYGGVEQLKEKAGQAVRFEDLTRSERAVLLLMFNGVRGGYFSRYFAGLNEFRLARWTKDELGAVHVIPCFSQECGAGTITFKKWVESAPAMELPERHQRSELSGSTRFEPLHPMTVGRDADAYFLLDGYHRACRFWGLEGTNATVAVYVPLSN